jgi:adenine-specific DNA methylase
VSTRRTSSSERLTAVERKDLGAFYTPSELTDFAANWAVTSRVATVLDPSCGDAAFLLSASKRLRSLGAARTELQRQLLGVDMNPDAVRTSIKELRGAGIETPAISCANFFRLGNDLFEPGPRPVDALIGNPPFIRYQLFRDENRALGLRAAARAGVILPALTSSWAPFVVHASTFLKEGGRMAVVLPGEILHVGYAAAVRDFLLRSFSDVAIIAFEEKVFPGALEEVIVFLGVKGRGSGKVRVRRLTSLRDLDHGPDHVLAKARSCTVAPGQRWLTTLLAADQIAGALDAVEKAEFRRLGEYCRVDIGVVTGANEFFVLGMEGIQEHRLPLHHMLPVISRAAHVQGARYTVADRAAQISAGAPAFLLVIDRDHRDANVERYLARGEARGLQNRYKCRIRDPWYRVPYARTPELFLTYMSNVAPRLVVNEAGATHTNTVHGVFLPDPSLAEPLAAAFMSSATLLSAEIEGRSYGGGVLKLEPREATRLLVPRMTPKLAEELCGVLPKLDALVREHRVDEASAVVDGIVLGKPFRRAEVEQIRSVLSSLRARRLARGKRGKHG